MNIFTYLFHDHLLLPFSFPEMLNKSAEAFVVTELHVFTQEAFMLFGGREGGAYSGNL